MTDGDFSLHRRAFLGRSATGLLGSVALAHLLGRTARGAEASPAGVPHVEPRAKRVICLFQNGGPSQMDLFDPKPELNRLSGKPYPKGTVETISLSVAGNLLGSPYTFRPAGQSGIELSEIIPHTAAIADEITLIRSMKTDSVCHETALRLIHSGNGVATGRPSLGAWATYALGTENENLPAFIVLPDARQHPIGGVSNWTNGFLPSAFQGTPFATSGTPVLNLARPAHVSAAAQSRQLDFLQRLNRRHLDRDPTNSELQARVANFETAARMQAVVPEIVDLARESKGTHEMYGMGKPESESYARQVLLARRLVEHGVRFVEVFLNGQPWDTHSDNAKATKKVCERTDQPSAALVRDLKQRGLLDSTMVIWMGEFGRTPTSQGADGRDHSRRGYSIWIAGGGFRRGYVHGATDEFAYEAASDVVTIHDLLATILHALGLDHTQITYPHNGRLESLTDAEVTGAKVVPELLM